MKIGVLSDAHGHIKAFERALSVLDSAGAESIYFLGDSVGYIPGHAVAEWLHKHGVPSIRGNHEAMLLSLDYPPERELQYQLRETRRSMPSDLLEYLASWPATLTVDTPCGTLHLVHGSPSDPTFGYVYPDTPLDQFEVPAGAMVFMGNTHRPFIRRCGGATFVSVGSCGLPRDSGCLASVCILDFESGKPEILRFDISRETEMLLRGVAEISPDVRATFARNAPGGVFGTLFNA